MASILIIEDNADHRAIFGRFLEAAGHQTIGTATGASGLACAQQQIPDLIVLDIRLPDMEGWAVASSLNSDANTQHIPVLIMTAEPLAREQIATQAFECDALLLKPFDTDIFLTTIARLLAHQPGHPGLDPSVTFFQRSVGTSPASTKNTPGR